MQRGEQRWGWEGSDVFVGQVLHVVLSELCALRGRQMLKQMSHVPTLVLLQQHEDSLQGEKKKKKHIIIYHQSLGCREQSGQIPHEIT